MPSNPERKYKILVANLLHSLYLGFLHWIKVSVGLDEQRLITKSFAGCFLLPVEGSQSSLTSLVGELSSAITLILMILCGEFTFS